MFCLNLFLCLFWVFEFMFKVCFDMLVLYVGVVFDLVIGVCVMFIYLSMLFVFCDSEYVVLLFNMECVGYVYLCIFNLIVVVFEECMVVLENGVGVIVIVLG